MPIVALIHSHVNITNMQVKQNPPRNQYPIPSAPILRCLKAAEDWCNFLSIYLTNVFNGILYEL